MKKILFIFFLFLSLQGLTANYYYSSVSGDDLRTSAQAQNSSTPWKTITKLNSFFSSLVAGDSIFLKSGEEFFGHIKITKSGIYIGGYGGAARPKVTGFQTLSTWSSLGGNKWESLTIGTLATCNLVTVNGVNTQMGRYPNSNAATSGYLRIDGVGGAGTTITDAALPNSATTDFSGGTLVTRPQRYLFERFDISTHSGTTLTYSPAYTLSTNNFYWIQNHINTLIP